jgi:hypothetical protein
MWMMEEEENVRPVIRFEVRRGSTSLCEPEAALRKVTVVPSASAVLDKSL